MGGVNSNITAETDEADRSMRPIAATISFAVEEADRGDGTIDPIDTYNEQSSSFIHVSQEADMPGAANSILIEMRAILHRVKPVLKHPMSILTQVPPGMPPSGTQGKEHNYNDISSDHAAGHSCVHTPCQLHQQP